MNNLQSIRCSALPRIMSCPASIKTPDVIINQGSVAALMGTAAHEIYAHIVKEDITDIDSLDGMIANIAAKYNIDYAELRGLSRTGFFQWQTIKSIIDVHTVECEMHKIIGGSCNLTGHPDVTGILKDDCETGIIIDWKTGRKDSDYIAQMKGYALLDRLYQVDGNRQPTKYLLIVVWTRLNQIDTIEVTTEELIAFGDSIEAMAKSDFMQYNPSPENCIYCQNQKNCPGVKEITSSAIASISDKKEMSGKQLVSLKPQRDFLSKMLKDFDAALKLTLSLADGEYWPVNDTHEIGLKDTERKTIIYNEPILSEFMQPDEVASLEPTVSITKIKKILKKHAAECIEKLDAAGCVKITNSQKLDYRKKA